MKIPRKTKYKIVNRKKLRTAVHKHGWLKSYVGLHKALGIFVKGIDIETGKYDWSDLQTVGYGCINKGAVIEISNNKAYYLGKDPLGAFNDSKQPLNGEWKLFGLDKD